MGLLVPIQQHETVPVATGQPDSNPVEGYLGRLSPASRRGILVALNMISGHLSNGTADAYGLDCQGFGIGRRQPFGSIWPERTLPKPRISAFRLFGEF
jgi:hypothetical protein